MLYGVSSKNNGPSRPEGNTAMNAMCRSLRSSGGAPPSVLADLADPAVYSPRPVNVSAPLLLPGGNLLLLGITRCKRV